MTTAKKGIYKKCKYISIAVFGHRIRNIPNLTVFIVTSRQEHLQEHMSLYQQSGSLFFIE